MTVSPANSGSSYADSIASGGTALELWSNSTASTSISLPDSSSIVVRAEGQQCNGAPQMIIGIDGKSVAKASVSATSWTNYTAPTTIAAGTHTVSVSFTNDYQNRRCDRNLLVDNITVLPTATPTSQSGAIIPFSAADVVNPARGQFESLGVGLFPQTYPAQRAYPAWPSTFDAGNRFEWRTLQPTAATTYDFSKLDTAIAQAAAAGKRFHFRVTAFNSCCLTSYPRNTDISVPDWLRSMPSATTNYVLNGVTYVVPNWNSDTYLTATENLIAALGRRYDSDERVEWFEFSGYGDFSENHISFLRDSLGAPGPAPANSVAQLGYYSQYQDQSITKASITRLVNATLRAFPNTRIVVAADNPEITRQLLNANTTRPAGIRGDCLGVYEPPQTWAVNQWSYYVQTNDPIVATVLNRWKTAPVVTEWCNWQPDGDLAYFQKALGDTVNYHVSLLSSAVSPYQGSTAMPAQIYDLWSRTNKYAGYRYAITGISLPSTATLKASVPITVQWTNFGTAPTYDNWQIKYEVRNSAGTVVKTVSSNLSLTSFAAAQNYTSTSSEPATQSVSDTFSLPMSGLAADTYTLAAKVVWNEHKAGGTNSVNLPPMNLALTGRDNGGGYAIGSFKAS